MICAAIVCTTLLAATPVVAGPSSSDRASYEGAKARAGRDAEAHVKLALWCDSHGMDAERVKHLTIAVLIDPAHTVARGLLGQVCVGERWIRPSEAGTRAKDDVITATLAQYHQKRGQAPVSPEGQWNLALWCERHGLSTEAAAHYTSVTRLDPSRTGLRANWVPTYGGRWLQPPEIAAEKAEAKVQAEADRQ